MSLSLLSSSSRRRCHRAVWCAMIMTFVSSTTSSSVVEAGAARHALVPGVPVRGEQLAFADGLRGNTYAIEGVDDDMAYEVKVSYTATNPARVWVDIEPEPDGVGEESEAARTQTETRETSASRNELRRRLLNVEKTVLSRDFLRSRSGSKILVTVRAEREGVYWEGEAGAPRALTYDVALGPLLASGKYGEIPQESVPVIALAVVCVIIAIVLAPYVANRLIWRAFDDENNKQRRRTRARS